MLLALINDLPKVNSPLTQCSNHAFAESARKKWKNLRDNFMRAKKARKNVKSGSAASSAPGAAYCWYDQLAFFIPSLDTARWVINVWKYLIDCVVQEPALSFTNVQNIAGSCTTLPLWNRRMFYYRYNKKMQSFRSCSVEYHNFNLWKYLDS